MPESKPRKRAPAKKARPKKAVKSPGLAAPMPPPTFEPVDLPPEARLNRSPIIEKPEPPQIPVLPEPADRDSVLVYLSELDPLEQELLIATNIKMMPSAREGGIPVPIPRQVLGAWAHQLRKLGLFCLPELATHELKDSDARGVMANHTAAKLRGFTREEILERAKEHNPELAKMLDDAKTPAQKRVAMAKLLEEMPVEQKLVLKRLNSLDPEQLAPR